MSSSPPTPSTPPPRPPFDPARWAMLVLAILVIGGFLETLIVVLRCTAFWIPACTETQWGLMIREWIGETLPVLVALVMVGRQPRQ